MKGEVPGSEYTAHSECHTKGERFKIGDWLCRDVGELTFGSKNTKKCFCWKIIAQEVRKMMTCLVSGRHIEVCF